MAAVLEAKPETSQATHYPESDGQPMAENTKQFQWIVTLKENLDALLTQAFVAGDLFWYPLDRQQSHQASPGCAGGAWASQGPPQLLQTVGRGQRRPAGRF